MYVLAETHVFLQSFLHYGRVLRGTCRLLTARECPVKVLFRAADLAS